MSVIVDDPAPDVVDRARATADDAAARYGVHVRELTGGDVAYAREVVRGIWGEVQVMADPLLRALTHAGTTCLGAFIDGRCIGTCIGFLGWEEGLHLHSHITGTLPDQTGKGVGRALKLTQRAVCLEHGVTEMRWTYDPLIARNAHFNLVTLGATVRQFLPDHYGVMTDEVNANDRSDRFEISWQLASPDVQRALDHGVAPAGDGTMVEIPSDYEQLRKDDPLEALRVRMRTRAEFDRLLAAGATTTWSSADGAYRFVESGVGATTS